MQVQVQPCNTARSPHPDGPTAPGLREGPPGPHRTPRGTRPPPCHHNLGIYGYMAGSAAPALPNGINRFCSAMLGAVPRLCAAVTVYTVPSATNPTQDRPATPACLPHRTHPVMQPAERATLFIQPLQRAHIPWALSAAGLASAGLRPVAPHVDTKELAPTTERDTTHQLS